MVGPVGLEPQSARDRNCAAHADRGLIFSNLYEAWQVKAILCTECGGPGRTRTYDQEIMSLLL